MTAQKLYEKAKKIAFEKQCSTNESLQPMLIKHGYQDESGLTLKTDALVIGLTEDLDEISTEVN